MITLRQILEQEGQQIVSDLKEAYKATRVNASGRLSETTISEVGVEPSVTFLQIVINKYGTLLRSGRGPGRVPRNFQQIILKWAADKGIQVDNPKSFAYLVARKIAREGTKAFPDNGPDPLGMVINDRTIQRIEQRIADEVEGQFVGNLDEIIRTRYARS